MRRHLEALLAFVVCASAALPLVACEQGGDELTSDRNGSHKPTTKNGSKTADGTGADNGDGTTTAEAQNLPAAEAAANAKMLFAALEPKLAQSCGPCHVSGTGGAPMWLGGADPYATAKAYKGILTDDPKSSILLTKPAHTGPAMPADLVPDVTAWLTAEDTAAAAAPATGVMSATIAIPDGAGSFELPTPGGKVTFTASYSAGVGILTLKTMQLTAPADTGVHATGLHIVIVHSSGTSTRDESLSSADANVAKGASAPLGVGLVVMPKIAADDKLQIQVDTLVASTGAATTTTTGGCKDVASFQTNAAPALKNNTCLNCHNTGGSGNGALDLSALALATPDFAKACAQAKNRIDTTTPAKSLIIVAPTGGEAAHPYKTAPASYTTAMTVWINAEK